MPIQSDSLLQLLFLVVAPPPGVVFAVQRGRNELLPPYAEDDATTAFAFTLRLSLLPDGSSNFRGPFAQGTPAGRFVYLNSGNLAGQVDTPWARRAKIKLAGVPQALVKAAMTRRTRPSKPASPAPLATEGRCAPA